MIMGEAIAGFKEQTASIVAHLSRSLDVGITHLASRPGGYGLSTCCPAIAVSQEQLDRLYGEATAY